jgi:hypothetical protein
MSRDAARIELHPEELLAKASRGALAPGEAADLRAHLARCPACALQVDLRGEIDRALAPTALDYEIGARAVERLFASPDWSQVRALTKLGAARRAPRFATRAMVALALLLGSSVGASALVLGTRGRLWGVTDAEPSEADAPPGHARRVRHAPTAPATGEPEAAAREPAAAQPVAAARSPFPALPAVPAPPAPQVIPAPAAPQVAAAPSAPPLGLAPPAPQPGPMPSPLAPSALRSVVRAGSRPAAVLALPAPPIARAVPRRTLAIAEEAAAADNGASELFGAAERARREGDPTRARRLYAQLAALFPGTREELAARVLRGQMLLDELDDAAAALRSFDHYLVAEPGGALAEEALVGRAEALRRLGRASAEAAAWSDLLARYPRSVHAERARERLAALVDAP